MTALLETLQPPPTDAGPDREVAELPAWPLLVPLLGYPLWWALGLAAFVWPLMALLMAVHLALRGGVRFPRGFGVWLLFLVWMAVSVVHVSGGGRMTGFIYRAVLYLSATVVFVYIFNARQRLPLTRVAGAFTVFWVWVVAGGFLGLLDPYGSITTPMGHLLPASLQTNSLVNGLVNPHFAEYNPNLPHLSPRLAAPFPYVNSWGSNFAMLVPFVFISLHCAGRRTRRLLVVLLALSLIPAFLSLNRGLFLSVGAGLVWVVWRFMRAGRRGALVAVVGFVLAAVALNTVLPVTHLISQRVSNSETNATRASLYDETLERTWQSPLFGYGTPLPSERSQYNPDVGTQGQAWTLMFSHGFPGLVFFVGWFLLVLWRLRRSTDCLGVWAGAGVVIALVQLPIYSVISTELVTVFGLMSLTLRERAVEA